MADYIYLLENRLSEAQRAALIAVRNVARNEGLTIFLVGGAVRDLTSGSPVRDLDVVIQGNALKLKKQIELAGGTITGEGVGYQALFARFAGGVRIEIGSTLTVTYPKPGKAVVKPATILDDLRRRDFTANAMALSLNEGSYGLLMDPLNGVADIENRELRLVSNYGFIEDPVRMVRAARFAARLGWAMDEKTQARYETGKQENYIAALGTFHRGYETEEIFHEEDPLRILRKLEEEGWMKVLFPAMAIAKANAVELEKLREAQTRLQMRGIHPEAAAANFPLLTAKLSPAEVAELKRSFARPGFVGEIESLEGEGKSFATQLTSKSAAAPSDSYRLIDGAKPEAVLWVLYTSKSAIVQSKLNSFLTEWPQARTKIPYTLMQEMRIVSDLAVYPEVVEKVFFELMDGRLGTVEEMKAFLETYSPPAPPPPVHLRRPRAAKKDAKGAKSRKKAVEIVDDEDVEDDEPARSAAEASEAQEESASPSSELKDDVAELISKVAPGIATDEPVANEPEPYGVPQTQAPAAVPGKASESASKKVAKNVVETNATMAGQGGVAAKKTAPLKESPAPEKSASAKKKVPARQVPQPVKKTAASSKTPPMPTSKSVPSTRKAVAAPQKSASSERKGTPSKKKAAAPAKKVAAPTKKVSAGKKSVPAKKSSGPAKKAAAKAAPPRPGVAKKVVPGKQAKKAAPGRR